MAQPSRDRLTAVPLHSSGPSAENKQCNSTGIRRNFLCSWRVLLGDEEGDGGFDGASECMNITVQVLDGTSKPFLVMGVLTVQALSEMLRCTYSSPGGRADPHQSSNLMSGVPHLLEPRNLRTFALEVLGDAELNQGIRARREQMGHINSQERIGKERRHDPYPGSHVDRYLPVAKCPLVGI